MKKFLTLAFALFLSISVSAQTTLTEAIDFSSTAHNGEEINLFEILDGGQYVLIDFFFSTCGPCKEYAPRIVDAYYMLGCNEGDVYFMEVSPTDNNKPYSTDSWISQFNIPYPTIHTQTGGVTGDQIYEMYQIKACPTMLLISPDREILFSDYHPASASAMVEYFTTNFDIEANYCGNQTPEVSVVKTKIDGPTGKDIIEASTKVYADFRANAAVDKFYYTISTSANLTSEEVIANGTLAESSEFSHTFEGLTESTTYFVYAQAVGHNGENGAKSVLETRTLCPGDDGDVEITLTVQVTAAYVVANATPNESTAEYHFGFVRKEYYEEGAVEGLFPSENQFIFLNSLVNDDYPLCGPEVYQIPIKDEETGAPRILPNTPYYVVAIGRNGEGEWFLPSIEEFMVEVEAGPAEVTLELRSLTDTDASITATPNVYTVEYHYAVVTKSIFEANDEEALIEQIRNDGRPAYAEEVGEWNNLAPNTDYVCLASAKNSNNEWGQTTILHFTTESESLSELEAGFEIYPNPASSVVNIKSALNGEALVRIVDMTGRCIEQVVTDVNNATISVENLNKGIYFISVQQDNNYSIQKLVVE